ncbi:hypothetical protein RI054_24g103490 [Pseudoscourfieldia marina]
MSESSHGNDDITGRSITGIFVVTDGAILDWVSRHQPYVSLHSGEAETIAASTSFRFLLVVGKPRPRPTPGALCRTSLAPHARRRAPRGTPSTPPTGGVVFGSAYEYESAGTSRPYSPTSPTYSPSSPIYTPPTTGGAEEEDA